MNEIEEYISKITALFLQYGIKSVSMDDIAKELGISKKTVYQVFTDKNDVVFKSIAHLKLQMDNIIEEFNKSKLNVIEKEIAQRKKYMKTYLKIKPTYMYDLKKFYPNIFDDFIQYKTRIISETTYNFIKEGKEQALFRNDLDPEFMTKLSVTLTFAVFHPDIETFSEGDLTSKKFSDQFFIYHMNGICSDKGRKLFNELLNNEQLLED
ncbi:TetR/AcrR family transcriptional regulator [Labilibacter marinus]|uniref:TetR/AcrR family transcriptional regulator n=1 Tax=Labilibacter marinus TaxID=1477105 RepID=UPI0008312FA8|nr:TetR/AcrR family transcriptional regulator [Labilibacter marinus]